MTECGATTSSNYIENGILAYNTDGLSQAKYLANQVLDFFVSGGQRMFIYNIIDGNGHVSDAESSFGLFHHDGTPKLAAMMFARLKHILSLGRYEDSRNLSDVASFVPRYDAQSLKVSGLTNPGQAGPGYMVMPKSDGSTMIALWNESIIDDGKGQTIDLVDSLVGIDFGSIQTYKIYDLFAESQIKKSISHEMHLDRSRTVSIKLCGHPVFIELIGN